MFDQLLKAIGGVNIGDIEKNAGDLLGRLEKLGGDVMASNGNVITALVAVAEDFNTLKAVVSDVRAIVDDLKAVHAAQAAAPALVHAIPSQQTVAPTPAPISAMDVLNAAAKAVSAATGVADPFAPKPLAHSAPNVNPVGGA